MRIIPSEIMTIIRFYSSLCILITDFWSRTIIDYVIIHSFRITVQNCNQNKMSYHELVNDEQIGGEKEIQLN